MWNICTFTFKCFSNLYTKAMLTSVAELLGIHEQAAVGFLTLMEALRYCKVSWFLRYFEWFLLTHALLWRAFFYDNVF